MSGLLPRFDHPCGIDLVDAGDIRILMLKNDNLYKICVPDACRNFPIERHYADVGARGFLAPPIDIPRALESDNPKHVLYKVLAHLFSEEIKFDFLDIGAFVGDVALRYANFARGCGKTARFFCFDPSLAGDLVPYNVILNGLEGFVEHIPVAISGINGILLFHQKEGHSDSTQAARGPDQIRNAIVPSITLSRFLVERNIGDCFIKLDTENMEQDILGDIREHLSRSVNVVCFEMASNNSGLRQTLADMVQTHTLYDIGYVPAPFCCREILPSSLDDFFTSLQGRPFGYTDVMAISRKMPGYTRLGQCLEKVREWPPRYTIVFDDPGEHSWGIEQAGLIEHGPTGPLRGLFRRILR